MARRSGLGRGLGALIPASEEVADSDSVAVGGPLQEVPVDSVYPNTYQPRKHIEEVDLKPLADSIRELGVLQPLLVRPGNQSGKYELIAGERRWRASRLAGLATVPVIIRTAENLDSLQQAIVENLHRKDLNPLDEAAAYRQLIDDFQMTHEAVGQRVGRSRAAVSNLLRLMQLPAKVQRLLIEEKISEGHARAMLGVDDEAFQTQLAMRAAKEGMSVRSVEEAVKLRNELAAPATSPVKRKKSPSMDAGSLEWQERFTDLLSTRVSVDLGVKRGKIIIEFADADDLERIGQLLVESKTPGQDA